MIRIVKTNSNNSDFILLVKLLNEDLKIRDGDLHGFYSTYNKIENIHYVLLAYENDIPIACGSIKKYDSTKMEIKRMYTLTEKRGKGVATKILQELESWARELGFNTCILETGKGQPEAISLYEKHGYSRTPNYGQYENIENSICFRKKIK